MSAHRTDRGARPVRICLVGCTGLLGDIIVDTVRRDQHVTVVARFPVMSAVDGRAAPQLVADDVDLVVWNCSDESEVRDWLDRFRPGPRVLATLEDGRHATLWELSPQRTDLGSLSPALLTEVIRTGGTTNVTDANSHRANRWEMS